jgi:CheY-like chemotaxis protein
MTTPLHALIIDDELFNLEVLCRLLSTHGISSTKIQDVRLLEKNLDKAAPIDLVFLDLEMPQMDGYQVFNVLKHSLPVNTPIIACTVHANEMSTVRELGFNGFIAKPLDRERFFDQVTTILRGEEVWDF